MFADRRGLAAFVGAGLIGLLAVSGCGGSDFTPAKGNSKAGPFEIVGSPEAKFDSVTGALLVTFVAVNHSGDKKSTSGFSAKVAYASTSKFDGYAGDTGCYAGSGDSGDRLARGSFESDIAAGERTEIYCINNNAAVYHSESDFDLSRIKLDYSND